MLIDKQNFTEFVDYLSAISTYCTDCQIIDGRIRIKTDNRAAFYDINLPEIFSETSMTIVSVKNFVDILKMFVPTSDDDKVELETGEIIKIKDAYTDIQISGNVHSDVLQNKFITDSELQSLKFDSKELLFSCYINEIVLQRIKTISKNFAVSTISLIYKEGEDIKLVLKSDSKTKLANFTIEVSENSLPGNYEFIIPFIVLDFNMANSFYVKLYKLETQSLIVESSSDSVFIYSGVITNKID